MTRSPIKSVIALVTGTYFLWCAWDPHQWHLIDGVNLLIHEAGHLVFIPFGQFMTIAGGSLFQIILPAVFVGYFYWNDQPYSAALVLFWVGESILNVSVYAGDSITMRLPLLGGSDSVHDWNYMLSRLGLIAATPQIAGMIRMAGTLVIIAALYLALENSRSESPVTTDP